MESGTSKIALTDLSKTFESSQAANIALDSINLDIQDGEFVCIVGPSGCGKTTILRIIAGLEEPTSGDALIRSFGDSGQPINSMVFQDQSLYPWLTTIDNVAFGLEMRGLKKKERYRMTEPFLEMVGLMKYRNHYPHQLSGGMKQRASLARAFANDPEVLLMDEPFAALDAQNKVILQDELLRIWESNRKTVLFITHAIDEALVLGDRVVVMTASPGKIKDVIQVNFDRPRDVATLKASPEFGELSLRIWRILEDEVQKARLADV
jgi:NitT/TauT family transport system ATP-binding protein